MKYLHDPTKSGNKQFADIPVPVEGVVGTVLAVKVHIGGYADCALEKYDPCPANDPDDCSSKWCMDEYTCPEDNWW